MQIPDFDDLDELLFDDESLPDEMILLPPCAYVWLLPRDSMISISPDSGHAP